MEIKQGGLRRNRGVLFQYFEWHSKPDASLWRELKSRAVELRNLGTTAVWLPPPYKSSDGPRGEGYAVYDMYDLGEFDQKGSVATKYGTRDEFLAAVEAVRSAEMHAYVDVVFNHRFGADGTEEIEVESVDRSNRNSVDSTPRKIKAWSQFDFPGRGDKYSSFKWRAEHFTAFDYNADGENDPNKIYRIKGKLFSSEVDDEYGNYDYLMGADVDEHHPAVREDLFRWGRWILDTAKVDGFRLDAVKHMSASFIRDWLKAMREHTGNHELFSVAEYWHSNVDVLKRYLHLTEGTTRLFDVPLHYRFSEASRKGRDYDLRTIFDGTLLQSDPLMAVTFVDNHDTQPGQSLESSVDDWFKQHAYALILLRQNGYPAVFYRDYFGGKDPDHAATCHIKLICDMLSCRQKFTYGDMHDYMDHPQCVGWVWTGDAENPQSMAVIMSTGDAGNKKMKTFHPDTTYRDATGHWPEPITTDENGEAEFRCPAGKVSIWCSQ